MTLKTNIAAALLLSSTALLSSTVLGAGPVQIEESVELHAKPAAVWALVGDYNGLYRWHPAVTKSEQTDKVRLLTLGNGAQLTETLTEMDNTRYTYRYKINQSPLPVSNYASSITVTDNGKNGTIVTWSSSFNAAGASDEDAAKAIRGVYQAGLNNLADLYN